MSLVLGNRQTVRQGTLTPSSQVQLLLSHFIRITGVLGASALCVTPSASGLARRCLGESFAELTRSFNRNCSRKRQLFTVRLGTANAVFLKVFRVKLFNHSIFALLVINNCGCACSIKKLFEQCFLQRFFYSFREQFRNIQLCYR
mgnify:CR=1 FL=1